MTAGNVHDVTVAEKLLSRVPLKGTTALADKAYGKWALREFIDDHDADFCIPPRDSKADPWYVDWWLYKERHLVEKFFLKLKEFRRVAIRYDKLACRFLAFVHLACIRILLTVEEAAYDGQGVMVLARITPKEPVKYALFNVTLMDAPERLYDTKSVPVKVPEGEQTMERDDGTIEIVNDGGSRTLSVNGVAVEPRQPRSCRGCEDTRVSGRRRVVLRRPAGVSGN